MATSAPAAAIKRAAAACDWDAPHAAPGKGAALSRRVLQAGGALIRPQQKSSIVVAAALSRQAGRQAVSSSVCSAPGALEAGRLFPPCHAAQCRWHGLRCLVAQTMRLQRLWPDAAGWPAAAASPATTSQPAACARMARSLRFGSPGLSTHGHVWSSLVGRPAPSR
mmetsp:Transcript_28263/g.83681  ORF Transcript_28263/g.83681 Transcript_28263/m.83681 type:complete len:166 (+) Transcript_28263:2350-2847(+)